MPSSWDSILAFFLVVVGHVYDCVFYEKFSCWLFRGSVIWVTLIQNKYSNEKPHGYVSVSCMNKRIILIARHLIFWNFYWYCQNHCQPTKRTVIHTLFNDLLQRIDNDKIKWIAQDNQIIFAFCDPKLNENGMFASRNRVFQNS